MRQASVERPGGRFGVWLPWLLAASIMAGPPAWLLHELTAPEESPYRWWGAVGTAAYLAWWIVNIVTHTPAKFRLRRALRKERTELAERRACMRSCYAELSRPVLDPTRVRDTLLAAEKFGVRWFLGNMAAARRRHKTGLASVTDHAWMGLSGETPADGQQERLREILALVKPLAVEFSE